MDVCGDGSIWHIDVWALGKWDRGHLGQWAWGNGHGFRGQWVLLIGHCSFGSMGIAHCLIFPLLHTPIAP